MRYFELPDSPIKYYIFKGGRGGIPHRTAFIPTTKKDLKKAFSDPMSFIWYLVKLYRAQLRVFYNETPDAIKLELYKYYKELKESMHEEIK